MATFKNIIYNWVKENFGESEADDPSWDIDALAECLKNSNIDGDELNDLTKTTVFDDLRRSFLEEDIDNIAETRGYTLTIEERSAIIGRYYKLDDETWERLADIMDDIKK